MKIVLALVLTLLPIQAAQADHIVIVNNSNQKINETKMHALAHSYRDIVLKHWKVKEYPITIYFVDKWEDQGIDSRTVGYHWYTDNNPVIYINVERIKFYKASLTVVMTHELAEAIVNPFCDKHVIYKNRRVYIEISDPTINTFILDRYRVADFAYKSFYTKKGKAPYSYTGILKKPFEPIGGYLYSP